MHQMEVQCWLLTGALDPDHECNLLCINGKFHFEIWSITKVCLGLDIEYPSEFQHTKDGTVELIVQKFVCWLVCLFVVGLLLLFKKDVGEGQDRKVVWPLLQRKQAFHTRAQT